MVKRNITQLSVYQIDEEAEVIPLSSLRNLYLDKTSEIVYISKSNKLYGIVCMEDALRCDNWGRPSENLT